MFDANYIQNSLEPNSIESLEPTFLIKDQKLEGLAQTWFGKSYTLIVNNEEIGQSGFLDFTGLDDIEAGITPSMKTARLFLTKNDFFEIEIRDDMQGKGFGRVLMEKILSDLVTQNFDAFIIMGSSKNALKFYLTLGKTLFGEENVSFYTRADSDRIVTYKLKNVDN